MSNPISPIEAMAALGETLIKPIVQEMLDAIALQPRIIEVRQPNREAVQIKGRVHPQFETVLSLIGAGQNVLLTGPAGCGKTTMAHQIAEGLGLAFSAISGSAGVTEAQFLGRLLPTGEGGKFEYHPSSFVRLYEQSGLFLLDELDAFDPNVLMTVNTALANGGFVNELRALRGEDTYIRRHPDAVILASANTFGTGADSMYVGRNQLDAATLDRFRVVEMDYDTDLERDLADSPIVDWVHALRAKARTARLRRVVSTRMIQKLAADKVAGIDWKASRKAALAGWTADELAKVGEA